MNLSEIDKEIGEFLQEKDKNAKIVFSAGVDFFVSKGFEKKVNLLIKECLKNGILPQNIIFSCEDKFIHFSNREWEKIDKIDKFFKEKKIEFSFSDMNNTFNIEDVKSASVQITDIANDIKKKNLSPLEALFAVYKRVTKPKYNHEGEDEESWKSRSIYSVLNGDKIVCVGYSELFKAIADELGIEEIKVFLNDVIVEKGEGETGRHSNVIVYVKDEKYGLDGYYYCDPTWDSGHEGKFYELIRYFLVPLEDIKHIKYNGKAGSIKNGPYYKESSFSSDGFTLGEELKNHLYSNPKIIEEVINNFYRKEIDNLMKDYNTYIDSDYQKYNSIESTLKKYNLEEVSETNAQHLKFYFTYGTEVFEEKCKELYEGLSSVDKNQEINKIINDLREDFDLRYQIIDDELLFSEFEKETNDKNKLFISNKLYILDKVKNELENNFDKYKESIINFEFSSWGIIEKLDAIYEEKKGNLEISKIDFKGIMNQYETERSVNLIDYVQDEKNLCLKVMQKIYEKLVKTEDEYKYFLQNKTEFIVKKGKNFDDYAINGMLKSSQALPIEELWLLIYNDCKRRHPEADEMKIYSYMKELFEVNLDGIEKKFNKDSASTLMGLKKFIESQTATENEGN